MLLTCATQVKNGATQATREKDKIFVSVLAGVTLEQLENVKKIKYKQQNKRRYVLILRHSILCQA